MSRPPQLLQDNYLHNPIISTSAREALYAAFGEHFEISAESRAQCITSWAPGRINLIGEHTDYNDGFVFPMALDLGVAVFFRPRPDDRVILYAANPGEIGEFSLQAIARRDTQEWLNYPMGVAQELSRAGVKVRGLEGVIAGRLPVGAGLSSSAALEVACAKAFLAAAEADLPALQIAQLCRRAENEFVGLNCGIMDQFIALFAEGNTALFLDTRSLEYEHVPLPAQEEYVVVVCDSGVKHALAASQYNARHRECQEAVALFQKQRPDAKITALRDISAEAFEEDKGALPELLQRRAGHVIHENARTLKARAALKAKDYPAFGKLMDASHDSLRDLYEVSCRELDILVEQARAVGGVAGSRMTGGGFGGCTVSLVAAESLEAFVEQVPAGYKEATGRACGMIISVAGGGAMTSQTSNI